MPPSDAHDEVVLTLPAAPEFVRLARLTCAGLATRIGMGYEEVEDLRIAVGEACSLLISTERTGNVVLTFRVEPEAVAVSIVGHFNGLGPDPEEAELSDQILDAVVDEHSVDLDNDTVTLTKRHGGGSADEAERA